MIDDDMTAADVDDAGESKVASKSDWEAVHARAMEEYARDYEHDRRNIEMAYADLCLIRYRNLSGR